jgi:hypothetical protein
MGGVSENNGMAIAALVVGIASLLICWPAGLVAIGLGIAGLKRAGSMQGKGKGLAIGGIVTGALGAVLGVVILFVFVIAADDVNNELNDLNDNIEQFDPNSDEINSDPSDGECNFERFMQDPDC